MPRIIEYRYHALLRMAEWGVDFDDVRRILDEGETIERRPADARLPSYLVLGFVRGRPIHVVIAPKGVDEVIVVTVYEPDPGKWSTDFRRRLK